MKTMQELLIERDPKKGLKKGESLSTAQIKGFTKKLNKMMSDLQKIANDCKWEKDISGILLDAQGKCEDALLLLVDKM